MLSIALYLLTHAMLLSLHLSGGVPLGLSRGQFATMGF